MLISTKKYLGIYTMLFSFCLYIRSNLIRNNIASPC